MTEDKGRAWIENRLKEIGKTRTDLLGAIGSDRAATATEIINGTRKVQSSEIRGLAAALEMEVSQVLKALSPDNQEEKPNSIEESTQGTENKGSEDADMVEELYLTAIDALLALSPEMRRSAYFEAVKRATTPDL